MSRFSHKHAQTRREMAFVSGRTLKPAGKITTARPPSCRRVRSFSQTLVCLSPPWSNPPEKIAKANLPKCHVGRSSCKQGYFSSDCSGLPEKKTTQTFRAAPGFVFVFAHIGFFSAWVGNSANTQKRRRICRTATALAFFPSFGLPPLARPNPLECQRGPIQRKVAPLVFCANVGFLCFNGRRFRTNI